MARRRSRKRPYGQEHPEPDIERARGGRYVEEGHDGTWTVQRVRSAQKSYTCPGCHQVIGPGTAHVVAIAQDTFFGAWAEIEDRRHWHSACWSARGRRR